MSLSCQSDVHSHCPFLWTWLLADLHGKRGSGQPGCQVIQDLYRWYVQTCWSLRICHSSRCCLGYRMPRIALLVQVMKMPLSRDLLALMNYCILPAWAYSFSIIVENSRFPSKKESWWSSHSEWNLHGYLYMRLDGATTIEDREGSTLQNDSMRILKYSFSFRRHGQFPTLLLLRPQKLVTASRLQRLALEGNRINAWLDF